ncbi:hypothetical protein QBC37DRAFT_372291 [Rhypophila decipiens]|uniref:Uncharacterized protein n=1 Tax=Rhypophila decipiens TaxID=261697 RepID=A0AAN6Y9I3_9PEZI|nr:hypothetical protein QBC37DRAFT_372291 [Rhypophila decipiens]
MQAVLPNVLGPKEVHPQNLHGRTAVVTGGVHGIGFEIARALASAGAKVIIVGRKKDHADDAISTVKSETPDADISWEECDLGKLSQVQSVFSKLRGSLDRLDFLVLSAGINAQPFDLHADGIDRHFGVNYLGQYYATNQLWPLLRKTSNMNEINNQNTGPTHLYGRTKLALLLFTKFGLVDKVIKPNSDNIYALAVHPGTVNTGMQDQWKDPDLGITGQLISWAMKSVGRSPEQGAYSALWALTAPDISEKDQNGGYYTDPSTEGSLSSQAQDAQLVKNLWDLSEQIVKDKLGNDALVDWSAK